jgi:hypothetical protein
MVYVRKYEDTMKGNEVTTVITKTEIVREEGVTLLDPAMEATIAEYNALKVALKELDAKKAAAEKAIRDALAGRDVGMINGVERIRVSHRNRSNIDRELLKTAFPEAYEATITETQYSVLVTK